MEVFLVALHLSYQFQLQVNFEFTNSSLHAQATFLYFSWWPMVVFTFCTPAFCVWTQSTQPELLSILHVGIDLSCAQSFSLKSYPVPLWSSRKPLMRSHNQFPEQGKVCSPEVESHSLFCRLLSSLPSGSFPPLFHLSEVMHKHGNEIWVYVQSCPYDLVWREEILEIKYTLNTGKKHATFADRVW